MLGPMHFSDLQPRRVSMGAKLLAAPVGLWPAFSFFGLANCHANHPCETSSDIDKRPRAERAITGIGFADGGLAVMRILTSGFHWGGQGPIQHEGSVTQAIRLAARARGITNAAEIRERNAGAVDGGRGASAASESG